MLFKSACFLILILDFSTGLNIRDSRIVGGKDAPDGAYPYQVSIKNAKTESHFCGGSIISTKTILTAGHCIKLKTPEELLVYVGSNKLSSDGLTYEAIELILHPEYQHFIFINDIGLIILASELKFNANVKAIPLDHEMIDGGKSVTLTGWGSTSYPGTSPENLQVINLKTISIKSCKRKMSGINPDQLCTYTKKGEGACTGDSGGPLALNGKIVGVVSMGVPCAKGKPDVFTRVSSFITWIEENIV